MDFRDTPDEAAFRKKIRNWLDENLTEEFRSRQLSIGPIDERISLMRAWQARLNDGGWIGIAWPAEYGGRGLGLIEQAIFYQEVARARAPSPINTIGLGMAGPTIIAHGSEEQKRRYLPKILSGEEIWCQGFSEPGAGSDFAGVRATAVLDGDHWVINGQKVWTSLAHLAQQGGHCIFVARTNPDAPKHKGLSYFLVDMTLPGIDVRPLVQITGTPEFNEMFFTDVRIPRDSMLGEPGDGWAVAMTTLLHERGTLGFAASVNAAIILNELVELARTTKRGGKPAIDDPVVRQRIAQAHIEVEGLRLTAYRGLSEIVRTGMPGPEGSLVKLAWSESVQDMTALAIELLGSRGLLESSTTDPEIEHWQHAHLRARGHTIEAGTSEILRNILAERVLGLPRLR